jgi:glycosyltransferase EpsE
MIRKEVYDAVGGYRVTDQVLGVEDYDLWFRIYAHGYVGYNLDEKLYSMFDGVGAAKRRTWKRRANEMWIRYNGYKMLNLPIWERVYALKPIIVGIIPAFIYDRLRK